MKILKTDAELILRQTHRFPLPQSRCNASCVFYPFCANSRDFESCRGFVLMNGENLNDFKRILHDPHIGEYIQNSYYAVLRSLNDDPDFAKAVLRDIAEKGNVVNRQIKKITQIFDGNKLFSTKEEPLQSLEPPQEVNVSLFGYYPVSSEQIKKPDKPPPPPKIETEEGITMNIREQLNKNVFSKPQERILETKFPEICDPSCPQARHCGYANAKNYGKPCLKRQEIYQNR